MRNKVRSEDDGDTGETGPEYGEADETTMLFPAVQRRPAAADECEAYIHRESNWKHRRLVVV